MFLNKNCIDCYPIIEVKKDVKVRTFFGHASVLVGEDYPSLVEVIYSSKVPHGNEWFVIDDEEYVDAEPFLEWLEGSNPDFRWN